MVEGSGAILDPEFHLTTLGVIAAAFINGHAVLLSVYHPPGWERAWAAFAFGSALLLGLYLAWSILRSRVRLT